MELVCGVGSGVVEVELLGGGAYAFVSRIKYRGLVRIRIFLVLFCHNNIMVLKITNVIISQCFHTSTFVRNVVRS
jgi:hypothetical protein